MSTMPQYRREALIRHSQPETLDEPLRISASNERFFVAMLLIATLGLVGIVASILVL